MTQGNIFDTMLCQSGGRVWLDAIEFKISNDEFRIKFKTLKNSIEIRNSKFSRRFHPNLIKKVGIPVKASGKIEVAMELSPKQQTVELLKKSNRILLLGHKNPSGDMVSSLLAFDQVLKSLDKSVDVVISEDISEEIKFLPFLNEIKAEFQPTGGKIIRIDTEKVPVSGMKYQKSEKFLDIVLDTDKNLKFEFIDVINGSPKPDLIIVLDTADVEKIDKIYDANTELFFETPVINIDHHAGNEYFGTVNLVDLTATSTAEILVSIFEAIGGKFLNPDIATCLLTGITDDTQSFRLQNTTPKSLTVAAQLLASGARQQDIISNLYKKKPLVLLKLWGKMLSRLREDKNHHFAWTTISLKEFSGQGITKEDVLDATDELLSNTPDAEIMLVLCECEKNDVIGKIKSAKGVDILPIAKIFKGAGTDRDATFEVKEKSLTDAEMFTLKEIHDFWGEVAPTPTEEQKKVWDLIEKEATGAEGSTEQPKAEKQKDEKSLEPGTSLPARNEVKEGNLEPLSESAHEKNADPIENALKSIIKDEKAESFSTVGDVIQKKKRDYLKEEPDINPNDHLNKLAASSKEQAADTEDVFDEDGDSDKG